MVQLFGSPIDADRCDIDCLHPERIKPLLGRTLGSDGATAVAAVFAILADPSRAKVLHVLALADDLCVCDIAAVLGLKVPTLSKSLHYLRERAIVRRRKEGRMAYYSLVDDRVRQLVLDAVSHLEERAA